MSSWSSFIDDFATRAVERWEQPGVALAIVERGSAPCIRGFGERRLGTGSTVDGDTLFGIASCSKTFAAVSAALLVDDGKLSFDDRVADILPWFELSDATVTPRVTVRDLLCNRLGITSSEGRHRQTARDRRDLVERLRCQAFRHPFRAQYGYCTDAFTVIGELVSAIAGRDWADFARERLWLPLGMPRTNADHRLARADDNHADPHIRQEGSFLPVEWIYEDHVATPAGGVNSTAGELARWLEFLLDGGVRQGHRLLSERRLRELEAWHTPESGRFADRELAAVLGTGGGGVEEPGYALGLYRHRYAGHEVFYHCGAIDGFRSIVGFLPGCGLGIAVLANADNPLFAKMLFQAAVDERLGGDGGRWHDAFLDCQSRLEAVRRGLRRRHAQGGEAGSDWLLPGRYRDDTGFGAAIVRRDGNAYVLEVGPLEFDLLPGAGDTLVAYKRWPYPVPAQFTLTADVDADGTFRGFCTDQDARFVYGPEQEKT